MTDYRGIPKFDEIADIKNKEKSNEFYIKSMLNRTQSMFEYSGLPDTIPQRILELYLQCDGYAAITKYEGKLYAMCGGLGGEPDYNNMPTTYTVSNPALNYSANLKIGVDCVVIPSDSMYGGLMPIISRYANMLTENDITMLVADINMRIPALISTQDDVAKVSAEKYLTDVEIGKQGIIAEGGFFDGIKTNPYTTTNSAKLTELVEYHQYLKSGLYNDLGLQSNYNMKRESLNTYEIDMNRDYLAPLVDNMLKCREIGVKSVNDLYGINITVKFASSWSENEIPADRKNDSEPDRGEPKDENK